MAAKTRVDGNRVTIDDLVYEVKPAGGQYAVLDEFGGKLGYFTVRGKTILPEDYGVAGAHPVKEIARLWAGANLNKDEKPPPLVTKGVCQVSTHEAPSDADLEGARKHRAWLKKQPGCKASYLVRDPATGKALTIAVWQTRAHLEASEKAAAPEGVALKTTSVDVFPFVEEP